MSKPIRILNVVTCMNRAGSETRVMDLFRRINRNKFMFDFLCLSQNAGDYDEEIRSLGGIIYRVPPLLTKNVFSYQKNLYDFFEKHKEKYPIVHSHLSDTSGPVLKAAHKARVKVRIAHARTAGAKYDWKYPLRFLFKKQTNLFATDFLSCSEKAGKWLFGENKMNSKNVVTLKNAVDAQKFLFDSQKREELRQSLGIKDEYVVGHVGRFAYPKNHNFIIDIFNELKKQNPSSLLLLVGDGDLRSSVEEKVKTLQLVDSVRFLGKQERVEDYYQVFDTFLFPSHYEGMPGSVIEAQAAGLPCLISESITDEVCITNLVKQISLKKGAKEWSSLLMENRNFIRSNQFKNIAKAGFDITTSAEFLQDYYEEKVRGS
jgi:glycosyltransferase involved in cell wall biosynthesis